MKIPKTFRLSEEAVAELDKQVNATHYLEDLILRGGERIYEVVPLPQLEALLEPLLNAQTVPPVVMPGKFPLSDIPGLTTADKLKRTWVSPNGPQDAFSEPSYEPLD